MRRHRAEAIRLKNAESLGIVSRRTFPANLSVAIAMTGSFMLGNLA